MAIPYQKILVPLDGSSLARQALPHAQMLAQQNNAELILLQVVPDIRDEIVAVEVIPLEFTNLAEQQQKLQSDALRVLQTEVANLGRQGIVAQAAVEVGRPAEEIVDYANEHAIDLIVMSTHGRTGFQRWVMGSVAGKITSAVHCPVLLVRPEG